MYNNNLIGLSQIFCVGFHKVLLLHTIRFWFVFTYVQQLCTRILNALLPAVSNKLIRLPFPLGLDLQILEQTADACVH